MCIRCLPMHLCVQLVCYVDYIIVMSGNSKNWMDALLAIDALNVPIIQLLFPGRRLCIKNKQKKLALVFIILF